MGRDEGGLKEMKWPILKCPFCGGVLRNTDVLPGKAVVCPSCAAQLQQSDRQLQLYGLIALSITLAGLCLLNVRGIWLVTATILLWFPVYVICCSVLDRIVPPRFEVYVPKDYKGLFGK